ncbi:homoserine kinase [Pokkaliibacter sp. CJK22405]|uniref:homoserine kinase n=1 Tax=Pokkaliibacter sp. CJK22405 TaxID=3384615 RepID=UPI0039849F66
MAVFTPVTLSELDTFLESFDLGRGVSIKGIDGGVENTNFFITLERDGQHSEYVLTLFEDLPEAELPFFVELTTWLARAGIPVPAPFQDKNGIALHTLNRRPALILPRFKGAHLPRHELTVAQCGVIGEYLARFHQAGDDFFMTRQAHRGVFWWRRESQIRAQQLAPADALLMQQAVTSFDRFLEAEKATVRLPTGVTHGDLFHDNALFHEGELTAIIDIYNASTSYLLYDLAITANDWCINPDGSWRKEHLAALLSSYAKVRPFTDAEHDYWPLMLQTAAMRFWLSRLEQIHPDGTYMKNPDEFRDILRHRLTDSGTLPRL